MANLLNFRHYKHVNLLENVGEKVKHAAELAGTIKGIYDLGRGVYAGFQTALPVIEAMMLVGL